MDKTKHPRYYAAWWRLFNIAINSRETPGNFTSKHRLLCMKKQQEVWEKLQEIPRYCAYCGDQMPRTVADVDHCPAGRAAKPALEAQFNAAMRGGGF